MLLSLDTASASPSSVAPVLQSTSTGEGGPDLLLFENPTAEDFTVDKFIYVSLRT